MHLRLYLHSDRTPGSVGLLLRSKSTQRSPYWVQNYVVGDGESYHKYRTEHRSIHQWVYRKLLGWRRALSILRRLEVLGDAFRRSPDGYLERCRGIGHWSLRCMWLNHVSWSSNGKKLRAHKQEREGRRTNDRTEVVE